ncbi:hypothetical protein SAMN05216391_1012 [Lachnospiraceae bacterium KHCPX20]|nr:hypothetical protein SAMN05216391_1012 [Lachnospiraceae bacterium KHCPX20]
MPNIFDGIKKMSDDDLRYQIATLEMVTMSNVMGQMGQQVSSKAVSFFGSIRKAVTGKETVAPKVVSIEERIENRNKELGNMDRKNLEQRIRAVLEEKINSATSLNLSNSSDDRISVEVIELALKKYKKDISEDLTYAQKADIIRHRYDERMLSQMQEKLNKQTEEEKKQTEEAIQRELDNMSNERKEDLRNALGVEKLTGEMVRKTLTTNGGIAAAMVAMEAAGFGGYMAITTIMHAVFTTFLGVTLPFAAYTGATSFLAFITGPAGLLLAGGIEVLLINRNKNKMIYELAAQIVWLSVSSYGHKFTPNEEELPSWLPSIERDQEIQRINEIHNLLEESDKLKNELSLQENELNSAKNEIQRNKSRIESLTKDKINAEKKIGLQKKEKEKIEAEKIEAQKKLKALEQSVGNESEELQAARVAAAVLQQQLTECNSEINQLYNELENDEKEITSLKQGNDSYQQQIKNKDESIARLKIELEEKTSDAEKKLEKNAKELENRWVKSYYKFVFDSGVFKDVVKNYEYNELGNIEAKLIEIHGAKDPGAVSGNRGKVKKTFYHVGFSTPSGFPSRIFYEAIGNQGNTKTVHIECIVKHNDPRYDNLCN